MALILNTIRAIAASFNRNTVQVQQVRNKYADWRMLKDHRRRQTVKEHGAERLRLYAIRKSKILPQELKAIADEEIAAYPRDASTSRIVHRCSLTSRPRGNVRAYRISRICFRDLADYNHLSGMQRAMW